MILVSWEYLSNRAGEFNVSSIKILNHTVILSCAIYCCCCLFVSLQIQIKLRQIQVLNRLIKVWKRQIKYRSRHIECCCYQIELCSYLIKFCKFQHDLCTCHIESCSRHIKVSLCCKMNLKMELFRTKDMLTFRPSVLHTFLW